MVLTELNLTKCHVSLPLVPQILTLWQRSCCELKCFVSWTLCQIKQDATCSGKNVKGIFWKTKQSMTKENNNRIVESQQICAVILLFHGRYRQRRVYPSGFVLDSFRRCVKHFQPLLSVKKPLGILPASRLRKQEPALLMSGWTLTCGLNLRPPPQVNHWPCSGEREKKKTLGLWKVEEIIRMCFFSGGTEGAAAPSPSSQTLRVNFRITLRSLTSCYLCSCFHFKGRVQPNVLIQSYTHPRADAHLV